jgi:nucleoside 2-deoxyribosyltransferase
MRRFNSIYLAGPDPYLPEGEALLQRKRELCEAVGLTAVGSRKPTPENGDSSRASELQARVLYSEALQALRGADAVIANLTPWRGPDCEPATAFEMGFASALGKPVFAYMNVEDEAEAEYLGRVEAMLGAQVDVHGLWRDPDGCEIEDLDLPESLMLWAEARRFFIIVTPDPLGDATGLELCLDALKLYAD